MYIQYSSGFIRPNWCTFTVGVALWRVPEPHLSHLRVSAARWVNSFQEYLPFQRFLFFSWLLPRNIPKELLQPEPARKLVGGPAFLRRAKEQHRRPSHLSRWQRAESLLLGCALGWFGSLKAIACWRGSDNCFGGASLYTRVLINAFQCTLGQSCVCDILAPTCWNPLRVRVPGSTTSRILTNSATFKLGPLE